MMLKKKVLFVCTNNSARSQMAEGLLKSLYGNLYEPYSAGTHPTGVHPNAVIVMKEIGIDISKQHSKSVDEYINEKFDYVVTICDQARESCPFQSGGRKVLHKGFKDPARFRGSEDEILNLFRKTRDDIKIWIKNTFKKRGVGSFYE